MPKAKRPSTSSAKLLPVKAGIMPPTQCRPVPMSIMFLRVTFLFTRAPATRVKMTAQRLGMLFTRVIRLYGTSEKLAEMFTRAEVHQGAGGGGVGDQEHYQADNGSPSVCLFHNTTILSLFC